MPSGTILVASRRFTPKVFVTPRNSLAVDQLELSISSRHKPRSINERMSSTLQAVVRGPSLTGGGKRPVFIPAHHADLLTGIGPAGARMEDSRTRPFGGRIDVGDISRGLFRWPIGVAYGRPLTKPREIGWFQEGPFGNLKFPLSSSPKQFRASPHE